MSISRVERMRLTVFITVGAVLIATFLLVSLGIKFSEKTAEYTTFLAGESVSGLEEGASVKYTGVPIGSIESISYMPDDLSRVKVLLRVKRDFPMKEGMYATTGMLGITGLKYIEILGGDNISARLKAGSVIPSKLSPFGAISGKVEVMMAKVEILLNNLNTISNPDSLRTLLKVFNNLAAITDETRHLLRGAGPNIDTVVRSTNSFFAKVNRIASNIESTTLSIDSAVSKGKIAMTTKLVDSTLLSLKQLSLDLSLLIRQSREDITVSMQNLRAASESASELATELAENPSLLLRGETQKERSTR